MPETRNLKPETSLSGKVRCLAAIHGQPVDRVPVFPLLMFLPAERLGISYRTYATNGAALAEAQVLVYRRFGVDAITACSDAFRLAADLGGEMAYPEEATPHLMTPLVREAADIARLGRPDPTHAGSRMADRARAVREMVHAVGEECLVLGWVDLPFAEACSLCGVSEFLLLLTDAPELAHRLLASLTEMVIDFALAQVDAGAPMIGAGDAAASLISAGMYREFALPYEQQVIAAIHARQALAKLHICGNTNALLDDMVISGADLFNVDHLVPLERAATVYGSAGKCYKGNLDPVADLLHATPEQCRRRAQDCLQIAQATQYMLSAGCEIPAGVCDETLLAFCEAVLPAYTPASSASPVAPH